MWSVYHSDSNNPTLLQFAFGSGICFSHSRRNDHMEPVVSSASTWMAVLGSHLTDPVDTI